jgi:hypothetical protein
MKDDLETMVTRPLPWPFVPLELNCMADGLLPFVLLGMPPGLFIW